MNAWSAHKAKKIAETSLTEPYKPLPDLLHDTLPSIPFYFPDIYLGLSTLYATIYWDPSVNFELQIWVLMYCFMLRSIFVLLTILPTCVPAPAPVCNQTSCSSPFHSTHDLMFSGHSLCFLFIGTITSTPLICIIGPISLVMARQHYTIDVCVSGLVYFLGVSLLS